MGLTSPDLEAFVPRARLSRARAGLQTVQGVAHTFTRATDSAASWHQGCILFSTIYSFIMPSS